MIVLAYVLRLYWFILLGRVIFSWIPVGSDRNVEGIRRVLERLTEPVLAPVRRALPLVRLGGVGLDLSVLVVMLVLGFLLRFV